jgi:hypothetical protein
MRPPGPDLSLHIYRRGPPARLMSISDPWPTPRPKDPERRSRFDGHDVQGTGADRSWAIQPVPISRVRAGLHDPGELPWCGVCHKLLPTQADRFQSLAGADRPEADGNSTDNAVLETWAELIVLATIRHQCTMVKSGQFVTNATPPERKHG